MSKLRFAFAVLALFTTAGLAPIPAQEAAPPIAAERPKADLEYFKKYLAECPANEIRCLWFSGERVGVGMIMTIDLHEATVITERDVFQHARQNTESRGMSHFQAETAEELLAELPASTPDVVFAEGLHISFWKDKKLQTVTYSKKATPLIVRRLYDVGGGPADFIYAK